MPIDSIYKEDGKRNERLERIASRILLLSRSSISINMRYMDPAVFALEPVQADIRLGTDGRHLFYDPSFLIEEYKKEKTTMTRNYMHVILHCIFQHNFIHEAMDQPYWDLACDIAVENLINQQQLPCFQSERQSRQEQLLKALDLPEDSLTAEKLYRWFQDKAYTDAQVMQFRQAFRADDHTAWYLPPEPDDEPGDGEADGDEKQQQRNRQRQQLQDNRDGDPDRQDPQQQESERQWKQISRRIQVDMETMSKEAGTEEGGMLMELRELHRERYDYKRFLQKFATLGEEVMVNDDEFDTIFYTYGLQLYEDMPLIEPLEYKEVKRIRDFVICIDTSASTSGETVQAFLQKTFNILKESETFFSKVNLYVIQADIDITNVTQIRSPEDVDKVVANLQMKGNGGTDFRPAFQYVNNLIKENRFRKLKGMLYFTDGYGPFPKHKPPYQSAIVFVHKEHEDPVVPPWAIKVVLDQDQILEES